MVFCGKASLSCKNCRIRRIKCNRLEPECSQCIRAGKKCPGYRDQLSLMFRDETVKVKKKFQEVESDLPKAESSSAVTPTDGRTAVSTPLSSIGTSAAGGSGHVSRSQSAVCADTDTQTGSQDLILINTVLQQQPVMIKQIQPTVADRGLKFYIGHYLFGHPDEPASLNLTVDQAWLFTPSAKTVATAVGLAGLSNLTGDADLKIAAWQNYVLGLRLTGASLTNMQMADMSSTMRSIVLLAIFEIVRGAHLSAGSANTHVLGATALMHSVMPKLPPSVQPYRNLMQYLYSLLIPCQAAGTEVPSTVLDYITSGSKILPQEEQLTTNLLLTTSDFINLSAYVRNHVIVDGTKQAAGLISKVQQLDTQFSVWERTASSASIWEFKVCKTTILPPEACYRGQFHKYSDNGIARIWGYYRWARILNAQLLLQLLDLCPHTAAEVTTTLGVVKPSAQIKLESSLSPVSETSENSTLDSASEKLGSLDRLRQVFLGGIHRLAEDTLVGTASFWRHPHVTAEQYKEIASPMPPFSHKGGAGAIGLAPVLFHVQAASCSPGMSYEGWRWSLDMVETVWALLGMEQARSIADVIRAHHECMTRTVFVTNGRHLLAGH